ncbi:DUF6771 family protein [Sphingomonas crocodyli]|uniref:Uncharacterized protein n=1 Tax=Sphingomonas crocodyli TaxID=1979270 RepID=A0A437LXQ1_9SPHN|nr:DUF6771 family protein [Sphingomonas crocodyli]RVT90195.1 hypothetical protein EOD43_18015 [Sphingomonas crocodyli]
MTIDLQTIIHSVIARAPQWVRQDLLAKEAGVRERAEEALAAMIASAIAKAQSPSAAPGEGTSNG